MAMRTHELHPALVHYPLAILPATALFEGLAASAPRNRGLNRAGRTLWWATAGSGLLTGLAGMAASQQIELGSDHARDKMWLHGIGNLTLVLSAFGVAAWRTRHGASALTAGLGIGAALASMYTAYLGGELVYAHGAGVKTLGGITAEQPALASRRAPRVLAVDAVRGLSWLFRRAGRALTGTQKLERAAAGAVAEEAAVH
ncbi:MAG TPA: DUF2231 domain-containing protein [Anaeromyxobacter sp.]|nr:DUF2231 domain-containing protein [Anaeromyxobacter sp.]